MSRNLSTDALKAIYAPHTTEAFLILLTLDHETLHEPLLISSDAVNTTSRGKDYISFPFELVLPDDRENTTPRARLVIDNVSREVLSAIKLLNTAPSIKMEIVRSGDPDTVEAAFPDFKLTNIKYNALTIQGDLTLEDFTAEPYPATIFSPSTFPAIF